MISFNQANDLIVSTIRHPLVVHVPIADATGYVLADTVASGIDVAPFRNSSKDGFAVRADLLQSCSFSQPVTLPVLSVIHAGDRPREPFDSDASVKLMTGAIVPDIYDAVVPVEDCVCSGEQVTFTRPIPAGTNVRPPGEDIQNGQVLFKEGHCLSPLDIGVLASIGVQDLHAYEKPSAMIVTTGDEVCPVGETLRPGQIYDSNRHTVSAMIRPFCRSVDHVGPVRDDADALVKTLKNSADHDVIITTGGVSAGDRDHIPDVVESVGWSRVFHKVAIKPGKPLYFARNDKRLFFGLPGNPLSVAVTCAMFVIPALRRLAGEIELKLTPAEAVLTSTRPHLGFTLIWPGRIRQAAGVMVAELSPKTSSGSLTALMNSDGLIVQHDKPVSDGQVHRVGVLAWSQIFAQPFGR